jgi:hypothetical protein
MAQVGSLLSSLAAALAAVGGDRGRVTEARFLLRRAVPRSADTLQTLWTLWGAAPAARLVIELGDPGVDGVHVRLDAAHWA